MDLTFEPLQSCVSAEIEYVLAHDPDVGKDIYFAAERLDAYGEFEVKARVTGKDLVGRSYQRCFHISPIRSKLAHSW